MKRAQRLRGSGRWTREAEGSFRERKRMYQRALVRERGLEGGVMKRDRARNLEDERL